MCIRDSDCGQAAPHTADHGIAHPAVDALVEPERQQRREADCLLYTSDAADERSSVDLGGRRIINKKNIGGSGGRQRRAKTKDNEGITRRDNEKKDERVG